MPCTRRTALVEGHPWNCEFSQQEHDSFMQVSNVFQLLLDEDLGTRQAAADLVKELIGHIGRHALLLQVADPSGPLRHHTTITDLSQQSLSRIASPREGLVAPRIHCAHCCLLSIPLNIRKVGGWVSERLASHSILSLMDPAAQRLLNSCHAVCPVLN